MFVPCCLVPPSATELGSNLGSSLFAARSRAVCVARSLNVAGNIHGTRASSKYFRHIEIAARCWPTRVFSSTTVAPPLISRGRFFVLASL